MGERSEANPKAGRKQTTKNATAFLFLAKELPKGMGERSEANPKAGRKQNKKNATAFLFLAKEPQKGIDERNKVKRSQFLTKRSRELAHGLDREQNRQGGQNFSNAK